MYVSARYHDTCHSPWKPQAIAYLNYLIFSKGAHENMMITGWPETTDEQAHRTQYWHITPDIGTAGVRSTRPIPQDVRIWGLFLWITARCFRTRGTGAEWKGRGKESSQVPKGGENGRYEGAQSSLRAHRGSPSNTNNQPKQSRIQYHKEPSWLKIRYILLNPLISGNVLELTLTYKSLPYRESTT